MCQLCVKHCDWCPINRSSLAVVSCSAKMLLFIVGLFTVASSIVYHEPKDGWANGNPFETAIIRNRVEFDTGYVSVRDGDVDMFWWFYYADGKQAESEDKPVILWVQGGPGLPASGVANFMEIGPLDIFLKKRNHTWVNGHNLLLIDSPAGTGFSRTTNETFLSTTDKQVVADFINTVCGFLKAHPEYERAPWHIFSQSYGGKLAPKIGFRLHKAIKKGRLKMKLKTVAIGSGFVDPKESIASATDYMYHVGLLDYKDYQKMLESTDSILELIKHDQFHEAFLKNIHKYDGIPHILNYNKNNINEDNSVSWYANLELISNAFVKPKLKSTRDVNVTWECLPSNVHISLSGNIMLSSKRYVEKLLNETDIKVVVYNGNFDAVTPMAGCVNWVHSLRWSGREQFRNTSRRLIDGDRTGYYKVYRNLSLWWVLSAGHWVPNDNPAAMKEILKFATGQP